MTCLNIAHRGGAALMPENSLAAFRHAIEMGADGVELDVQLSAEGHVVVYHDFRLNPGYTRLSGGPWMDGDTPRVKDLMLDELRRFEIGATRPDSAYAAAHPLLAAHEDERIPTLKEVLALVKEAPGFRLMVELKCDYSRDSTGPVALAGRASGLVEEAGLLDRTIFVGFEWHALARVKQLNPEAAIWCTTDENMEGSEALFEAIKAQGGDGWFPHFSRVTPESAVLARARGLKLGAWTVNDEENMRRLQVLGVDAICTDRPDMLQTLEKSS